MVHNFDLSTVSEEEAYRARRALFEARSALLFPGQGLAARDHMRLAEMFGPVEDRKSDERKPGEAIDVSLVSMRRGPV